MSIRNRGKGPHRFCPVRRWLIAVVVVVGTLVQTVAIASSGPSESRPQILTVGYVEFPPLEFMDEHNRASGRFIELTRQVAAEAGYDLEFAYLPISRIYFYLKNGVIDLWPGLSQIPELQDQVLESEISPVPVRLSVWSLDGSAPVTRFESFHDRILILITGYTYGGLRDYLEQQDSIRLTYAPNHLAALYMLQRDRGHYLLDYQFPVREVMKEQGISGIQEQEVRTRYSAWLFSRKNPHSRRLQRDFDAAYRRLEARGEVPPAIARDADFLLPGFPAR
ncbi:substrate-binding periplasmic protein [Marinobacter sp. SS21]|uniref:substrate-binding periplasmic protein n=1 Tax=Marinobacter sp. SS21 TaxID=2979460 RepID=UPI00232ECB61|nr:transporter substrate-binding domain-containing protein [Marinobacter sp. SS21]MDC0660931.1 transporter substrate-binding domain-containing protein [Marinobacter sp. SS21]